MNRMFLKPSKSVRGKEGPTAHPFIGDPPKKERDLCRRRKSGTTNVETATPPLLLENPTFCLSRPSFINRELTRTERSGAGFMVMTAVRAALLVLVLVCDVGTGAKITTFLLRITLLWLEKIRWVLSTPYHTNVFPRSWVSTACPLLVWLVWYRFSRRRQASHGGPHKIGYTRDDGKGT